jgi:hypothetical protein
MVGNARKKKSNEKLTLEARYLTKEIAQQLRAEATAKEDAKRDALTARAIKNGEQRLGRLRRIRRVQNGRHGKL